MLYGYAIKTTYHGPTNYRGSRVSAERMDAKPSTGKRERVTIDWECEGDGEGNHRRAAQALIDRNGWTDSHEIIGAAGWTRGGIYFVAMRGALARVANG